jgi:uncharacterized protein
MKTTTTPAPACGCKAGNQSAQPTVLQVIGDRWRRLDKPVLAVALILIVIALIAPAQLQPTLEFTGRALLSIAPWLALSVMFAAYAKASSADTLVARAFTGSPGRMILLASLFGALSPFCSCGVVPLIAGLLGAGVPLAPVMAFWLSSPLMDPNMFIMTAASLGMEFAIVKTAAAVGIGLLSGAATHLLDSRGLLRAPLRHPHVGASASLPRERVQWNIIVSPPSMRIFADDAARNGWFLLRWMTIAFLLESLMIAYVPPGRVVQMLGQDASAIPLAVLVGIPAYLNGFAALPLVRGLIDMGMSPAVGLAFLVAGGATSIPAATAVWALVKPRIFGLYVSLAVAGTLVAAYVYSALLVLA